MSGTNHGGSAIAMMSIVGEIAFGVADHAQQVLGVQDADDVFRRTAPQRNARVFGAQHRVDDLLRRIVGVDRHHLGAVDHDVGHFELAQAKDVLDVFGLAVLHLAVLGRLLDQAFDLDVGQDFVMRAFGDARACAGSSAMQR